jgi:Flp pilus assembly protein TadG
MPGSRRGNNIIEFTLLAPWFLFLFIGAIDMGIYSYALISVQSAARVVALYCSSSAAVETTCESNPAAVCTYALGSLRDLPNVPSGLTTCSSSPVTVTVTSVAGADGSSRNEAKVTIAYVAPALAGIPTRLPGQYTVTRTVAMRIRG